MTNPLLKIIEENKDKFKKEICCSWSECRTFLTHLECFGTCELALLAGIKDEILKRSAKIRKDALSELLSLISEAEGQIKQ